MKCYFQTLLLLLICLQFVENKPRTSLVDLPTGVRSDVIVTSGFPSPKSDTLSKLGENNEDNPGWLRRQLLRFGEMTSSVGNKLGGFTSRVSTILDKLCGIIKTIIPVIAAVCHVGQFEFCGSMNEAPQELADALSATNLDIPD